jgi:hypothetical protein
MRSRTFTTVFASLLALILPACLPAQALEGVRQLEDRSGSVTFLGLELPPTFAGVPRVSIVDSEKGDPGSGFSANYRLGAFIATIYIYDLRQPSIPDDVTTPIHLQNLELAKQSVVSAQKFGQFRMVEFKKHFTVYAQDRPRLICTVMLLQHADRSGPSDGYICAGAYNNKFFKIRITAHEKMRIDLPEQGISEELATLFIKSWVLRLWHNPKFGS